MPCGRGLPVLTEVFGRSTDFVRTPPGNTMHALALIYEVRDKPGVRAFKFIQERGPVARLLRSLRARNSRARSRPRSERGILARWARAQC